MDNIMLNYLRILNSVMQNVGFQHSLVPVLPIHNAV